MGLIGSIFGGAIGLALGGPLGAIAGAVIGHGLTEASDRRLNRQEEAQASYFICIFSMLAKMAKADGQVTSEEIDVAQRFMRYDLGLDPTSQRVAIDIFNTAKDSPLQFDQFAGQFYDIFENDPLMRRSILDLLIRMAAADGNVTEPERQLLEEAARIFRLEARTLGQLLEQHAPTQSRAYAVLGVPPDASDEEIKRAYRKLVTETHPDKAIAKGLPEEFVKYAETRFREIQGAYEEIQGGRGR